MKNKRPIALVVLDGVGQAPPSEGNAVKLASTPNINKWTKEYPNILINASGTFVGLPDGQMGNSEVGHTNIGAGRIIYQSLELINNEIKENKFLKNKVINEAIEHVKKHNSKLHILGLVSDGGVHSHIDHIVELAKYGNENVKTYLHAFTDGRDVGPKSAWSFSDKIIQNNIKVASISGRYYSMVRDKSWDRVQKAYDVLVNRIGNSYKFAKNYINEQYKKGNTDEFLEPAFSENYDARVEDNDAIIFANFRPDRARELSHMFIGSNVKETGYDNKPVTSRKNLYFATMREYTGIKSKVIYPNDKLENLLGIVLEEKGFVQMRAAETEKYPHVTFFLDGGEEINKKHEKRILVDSPKVSTYDLTPEMSSRKLTDKIIENADDVDVFIINYAQPDMVGHTGVLPAVIKSVEVADEMLGKLYDKIVSKMNGILIVTADHGNADEMIDDNGEPITKHTTNPVQVIITDKNIEFKDKFKRNVIGKLGDLAPTILKLLDVKKPKEMTGEELIK